MPQKDACRAKTDCWHHSGHAIFAERAMSKRKGKRARFYIDECVPDWVMVHLWARGHNAHLSKDDIGPSSDDSLLLRQAKQQRRVFVTTDKGKNIRELVRGQRHPGVVVISGDSPNETLVCSALDTLLRWGAKREKDYENLYVKISERQVTIETQDGNTLIIGADGSVNLLQVDGTICDDRRVIDRYIKALG